MPRHETIASRLVAAREMRGLNPSQVASASKLSAQSIRDYEGGDVKPGADAIKMLCVAYAITSDWLLGLPPVQQR